MKTIRQICEEWFYTKDKATSDLYLGELIEQLEKREKEKHGSC